MIHMSSAAARFRADLESAFAAHLGCTTEELGREWLEFIYAITEAVTGPALPPAGRDMLSGLLARTGLQVLAL